MGKARLVSRGALAAAGSLALVAYASPSRSQEPQAAPASPASPTAPAPQAAPARAIAPGHAPAPASANANANANAPASANASASANANANAGAPAPASAPAPAPESPAPESAAPKSPIPDAVFAALRGQRVILTGKFGATVAALLLASDGDTLIIAVVPKGQVAVVAKREVYDVRVDLGATAPVVDFAPQWSGPQGHGPRGEPAPEQPLPPNNRYFGMHLGVAPSVMLDFDYRHFYGFANVSIMLPFLTRGNEFFAPVTFGGSGSSSSSISGPSHLWAFTFGGGATFRLAPTSRWQFDLFAIAGGSNWDPNYFEAVAYAAFGVGLGFHVTLEQGFSFAIKAPILGAATSTHSDPTNGTTDSLGTFFGAAAAGLPLLSLGYRF